MKKPAMILGALLVIMGVAAILLARALQDQRAQNSSAMARVVALESVNAALTMTSPVNDMPLPMPNASPSALSAPVESLRSASGPGAAKGEDPLMAMIDQVLNSSQGSEFQRVMMRQGLEDRFPNLAKDMNLGGEKADKLLDLLTAREVDRGAEMLEEMRGRNMDRAARADQARSRAERQRAFDAELKALLGDKYASWNEYERAAQDRQRDGYVRVAKEEMRNSINSGGAPLTDAQFAYLDSAITAEQNRIDKEFMGLTSQQQMERFPEANARLLQVASSHLNPQQLEGYRRYLKQQEATIGAMGTMGALFDDE